MRFFTAGIFFTVWTLAGAVWASPTVQVKGGSTTLALSDGFLSVLEMCDTDRIKPGVMKQKRSKLSYPIAGGAIDLETFKGEVHHNGGLAITCDEGSTVVSLSNFTLDTMGEAPVVSAMAAVDGSLMGRVLLFVPGNETVVEVSSNGKNVYLRKVALLLTDDAAVLLNDELGGMLFSEGQLIGQATTKIKIRKASEGKSKGKGKGKGKGKKEDVECEVAVEGECEGEEGEEGDGDGDGDPEGEGEEGEECEVAEEGECETEVAVE